LEVTHPGIEIDDPVLVVGLPEFHQAETVTPEHGFEVEWRMFRPPRRSVA
jgi:hypothetical protein